MKEEILEYITKIWNENYKGKNYEMSYVFLRLKSDIRDWSFKHNLNLNMYTPNELNLLILEMLCDERAKVR